MASEDSESAGWCPKTMEPAPDQIYLLDKLREVIDIDTALSPGQRDALYKVVEQNQTAFSFNGRLGHLLSKVHIMLAPDTKPISMALYYASLAKRKVIDKQLDLWLSQGVIEESKQGCQRVNSWITQTRIALTRSHTDHLQRVTRFPRVSWIKSLLVYESLALNCHCPFISDIALTPAAAAADHSLMLAARRRFHLPSSLSLGA